MKSGNLNFLEPSGPLQACNGTDLPLHIAVCMFCAVRCSTTLTEVFPCFFLSCKTNARVTLAKTGHGPHSYKLVVIVLFCRYCAVLSLFMLFCCYCLVLFLFVLFCYYLCCSMYCLCVNVYCTTATGCLPNCS